MMAEKRMKVVSSWLVFKRSAVQISAGLPTIVSVRHFSDLTQSLYKTCRDTIYGSIKTTSFYILSNSPFTDCPVNPRCIVGASDSVIIQTTNE
jgi:hypothetical protein